MNGEKRSGGNEDPFARRARLAAEREADRHAAVKPGGKVDPEVIRALAALEDGEAEDEVGGDAPVDEDGLRRVTFRVSHLVDKRIDRYLTDRIPFMSRNQLQRLIDVGGVQLNAKAPKASTRVRGGDVIEVVVPPPPAKDIQPEEIPIEVLYEDRWLIVLNKSPDIIVHPARSHLKGTLVNALAWHFRNVSRDGGGLSSVGSEFARPGVVHRLDRYTSGVMVVAKDDEAHWKLGRQFELRQVDKRYLAVVEGEMEKVSAGADVIEAPIGPHPSRVKGMREKMTVRHDELGKPAVTIYRIRERYRGWTLVELELKTGRTHQIRVHLSHLGFPIAGDDMYGGHAVQRRHIVGGDDQTVVMGRQALHAATLGFAHPVTGEKMQFTAPLRDDMAELVRLLREHRAPERGPMRLDVPGATVDLERAVS